jgi:multiple antibiotic resistance protein
MLDSDSVAFALLATTSLLAIVNPLSAVPIYLAMTADLDPDRRRHTLQRAVITAVLVLIAFTAIGSWIMRIYGITTPAFRIAGGIIFLGIGADMLQARRSRVKTTEEEEVEVVGKGKDDIGIIPLGLPTLAGPGAITTVVTLNAEAGRSLFRLGAIYLAIVIVMGISWAVLAVAPMLLRRFGQTGLNVMTRIMGLLVMVVGVQFVIDGVRTVAIDIMNAASR